MQVMSATKPNFQGLSDALATNANSFGRKVGAVRISATSAASGGCRFAHA